jgi:hypothetical protein
MQRISTEMGRGGAGTQDGAESQCRGGQRREQEIKDGAGSQCRDQQRRSRNSRTVQRVSAEVGRVGAGTQGRCRESVQRWAEEEQELKDGSGSQCRGGQRRSRKSRTMQGVSAEVGMGDGALRIFIVVGWYCRG